MSKRINRDDVDKLYDYDIYIPGRTVYIGSTQSDMENGESGVEAIMAERAIKALLLLDQKDEPITIIMNNPGGDWYHGMAIYDAIKGCKSHVTIKVYGMAMSMGAVILQAADMRIMTPNSRFMIHYGTMGMDSTHAKIFENWAEESKKLNKEMEQIFLAKMLEKNPKVTLHALKKMLDYDTILNARETIEVGLADKVLGDENE
jgi:ATP-dependent Clp endopeptidase proteolytic subunit ClpP